MKKKIIIIIVLFLIIIVIPAIAILLMPKSLAATTAVNYDSNNLAIGTFFTANYPKNASTEVDQRFGIYSTDSGENFTYLGESGLYGRDPRILYKNGVFYIATTKGGSNKGGYTFNIFKSKDLSNWTLDITYPYDYRYEVGTVKNNKYGLPTNSWGPKWVDINGNIYLMIYSTRFDGYGAKYYFLKGDSLSKNNVTYSSNITLDTTKGVLVKEYAVLDANDRAQYQENSTTYYMRDSSGIYNKQNVKLTETENGVYSDTTNNCTLDTKYSDKSKLTCSDGTTKYLTILTKKKAVEKTNPSTNKKMFIQATCPWYEPNYPIFDAYISQVNFGSTIDQNDLNKQNLSFNFKKMLFTGFDFMNESDDYKNSNFSNYLYFLRHSNLPMTMSYNANGETYKYAVYTKSDPYGTIQRWLATSINGPWYQIDDAIYPASYKKNSDGTYISNSTVPQGSVTCNKLVDGSHPARALNNITPSNKLNDNIYWDNHFEGAFINSFNNNIYFYSDHYNALEYKDYPNESKNKFYGIYYSKFSSNSNMLKTNDHLRFNSFIKVNTNNTELRPSKIDITKATSYSERVSITNNVLRNGDVFRPTNSNGLNTFKAKLKNISNFNLFYKVYNDGDKYLVIIKSNRAIKSNDGGFKYVTEGIMSNSNTNLTKYFGKYDKSLPYTAVDILLYKSVSKNSKIKVTLTDKKGETKTINLTAKNPSTDNVYKGIYKLEYKNNGYENYGEGEIIKLKSTATSTTNTLAGWKYNGTFYKPTDDFQMPAQDIVVEPVWNYKISYDLKGGTVNNPTTYNSEESLILNNPTKPGYIFTGWTGSNGTTPQLNVVIPKGTTGNKSYTANYIEKEYTIELNKNKITLDVGESETILATIEPNDASEYLTWKSNDTAIATIDSNGKITGKSPGVVTITAKLFEHNTANCEIIVTKNGELVLPFKDVPKDSWYYESVKQVYFDNLISGYSNIKFAPHDKITRGQLVTILYNMSGRPKVSGINNRFSDVPEGKYYSDAVKWAANNKIISGYGGSYKFGPGDPIIRQDLAVILNNYAKNYKKLDIDDNYDLSWFVDYNYVKGKYAEPALKWAVKNVVMSGQNLGNGKRAIDPFKNTTRAEAAAMITNFIKTFDIKKN